MIGSDTDFTQIHLAVSSALKRVYSASAQDERFISAALKEKQSFSCASSSPLNTFLANVSSLLQLRYQGAWPYILDLIESFFESMRGDTGNLLLGHTMLEKLINIYEASINHRVR